jgi:hypothetical protein
MATKATPAQVVSQDDVQGAEQPRRVKYDGQLEAADLALILRARRASATRARTEFLRAHPEYIACAVAGCDGLVGPAYQSLVAGGRKYGLCPRRQVHARLMPAVFGSRAA